MIEVKIKSGLMILKKHNNKSVQVASEAFTCLASSPGSEQSCQTWVSWLGLRSCRASLAYRCEVRSLEEWWVGDPREPPEE